MTSVRDLGWYHHTIATWLTALAEHGFRITHAREPLGAHSLRPDAGGPWKDIPRFFAFRASTLS